MVPLRAEASSDVCAAVCFGFYPHWPVIRGELPEFLASVKKIKNNKTHTHTYTHEKSTPAFLRSLSATPDFYCQGSEEWKESEMPHKTKQKTDVFMGRF